MKKLKPMKKLLLILLCVPLIGLGQERTSQEIAKISKENLGELTESTGWMLNADKEWVSLKNTIPVGGLGSEDNDLLTYEDWGLGTDNFLFYQLRELEYNNKTYYILIKKYRDGWYEYPTIQEDWYKEKGILGYIFDKSELEKMKNIKDGESNMIEIQLIDYVDIEYESEYKSLELMTKKIDWNDKENKYRLILHIAPYKDKNIVQFQVYATYSKYNIICGIIKEHKVRKEDYSMKDIYLSDELFKHCYFETTYSNFIRFLSIDKQ